VLAHAIATRQALVTEKIADFIPLLRAAEAAGDLTAGTVLTSPRSMPRSRETIEMFIVALAEVCKAHPEAEGLASQVIWLALPDVPRVSRFRCGHHHGRAE
jgi:hypothetical protein